MTAFFTSLVRIAATLIVVANVATIAFKVLEGGDSVEAVVIAVGLATVGPLLVALADLTSITWALPAFLTALIGDGAALGVVGFGELSSATLLVAVAVAFLACVAGTLVRAQASLEEPRSRL